MSSLLDIIHEKFRGVKLALRFVGISSCFTLHAGDEHVFQGRLDDGHLSSLDAKLAQFGSDEALLLLHLRRDHVYE